MVVENARKLCATLCQRPTCTSNVILPFHARVTTALLKLTLPRHMRSPSPSPFSRTVIPISRSTVCNAARVLLFPMHLLACHRTFTHAHIPEATPNQPTTPASPTLTKPTSRSIYPPFASETRSTSRFQIVPCPRLRSVHAHNAGT